MSTNWRAIRRYICMGGEMNYAKESQQSLNYFRVALCEIMRYVAHPSRIYRLRSQAVHRRQCRATAHERPKHACNWHGEHRAQLGQSPIRDLREWESMKLLGYATETIPELWQACMCRVCKEVHFILQEPDSIFFRWQTLNLAPTTSRNNRVV